MSDGNKQALTEGGRGGEEQQEVREATSGEEEEKMETRAKERKEKDEERKTETRKRARAWSGGRYCCCIEWRMDSWSSACAASAEPTGWFRSFMRQARCTLITRSTRPLL